MKNLLGGTTLAKQTLRPVRERVYLHGACKRMPLAKCRHRGDGRIAGARPQRLLPIGMTEACNVQTFIEQPNFSEASWPVSGHLV